ncbi:MAG: hypothetical protein ACXWCZ_08165 [Flavisolibacter sp.]
MDAKVEKKKKSSAKTPKIASARVQKKKSFERDINAAVQALQKYKSSPSR